MALLPPISVSTASPFRAPSGIARAPRLVDGADVTIKKGELVWDIAARDLGLNPRSKNRQEQTAIANHVAAVAEANDQIPDINKTVVGDQLKLPPKRDGWTKPGAALTKPPAGTAADAASQTASGQSVAKAEKEAAIQTLDKNVAALVANASKPMTDTQRSGVVEMARDLLKRTDALGVGKDVRESPAGKTLVSVIDSIAQDDVDRSVDALAKEVAAAKNSRDAPLTEDQKAKYAARAALPIAKAKELRLSSESMNPLQSSIDDVATTAVTHGTEAFANEAIETQNSQRAPLSEGLAGRAKMLAFLVGPNSPPLLPEVRAQTRAMIDAAKASPERSADPAVRTDIAQLEEDLAYDAVTAASLKYGFSKPEQLSVDDLKAIKDTVAGAEAFKVGKPSALAALKQLTIATSAAPATTAKRPS